MNKADLLQTAEAMKAFAEGKLVQSRYRNREEWQDCSNPSWDCYTFGYRPKPEPKTRWWNRIYHVPAICWIRFPSSPEHHMLVTCIGTTGVWMGGGSIATGWHELERDSAEYSTDRITWKPCVVTEES